MRLQSRIHQIKTHLTRQVEKEKHALFFKEQMDAIYFVLFIPPLGLVLYIFLALGIALHWFLIFMLGELYFWTRLALSVFWILGELSFFFVYGIFLFLLDAFRRIN
jgi:hypothetical protein